MSELVKIENGQITVVPEKMQQLKAYQEIRIKADMLEKEIKQELLEAMEKHGIKKWDNELFTVTLVEETSRSKLDTKALKERFPELVADFTSESVIKSHLKLSFKE